MPVATTVNPETEDVDPETDEECPIERYERERKIRENAMRALFDYIYKASIDPITGRPQWTPFCQQVIKVVETNEHPTVNPSIVWMGGQNLSSTCMNEIHFRKGDFAHYFHPDDEKPDAEALLVVLRNLSKKTKSADTRQ